MIHSNANLKGLFWFSAIGLVISSALNFPTVFFDSYISKYIFLISLFVLNYFFALIFTLYFRKNVLKVFFVSLLLTTLGIVLHAFIEWGEASFMRFFTFPALALYILAHSIYITVISFIFKSKATFRNSRIDVK